MLKTTPLNNIHKSLGARMVDFAGYEMPVNYSSIQKEHLAVRTEVGLFDVSHMGQFIIRGKEAAEWMQHVTSNDVSQLKIGQAQYTYLPNEKGGIVDDLILYRLEETHCSEGEQAFMMVVNASNITKDWDWIHKHKGNFDCDSINISDKTALLALQGPFAERVLQKLTDVDLSGIPFYHFNRGIVADIDNVIISATGYTGSGGFELYFDSNHAEQMWQALMTAGEAERIQPCGLGARDTLRLEAGYCLYGNDIDDTTSPFEAGLSWITKLKSKTKMVGLEKLQELKSNKKQKLVGLKVDGRRVPRTGYDILSSDGGVIGRVTSGTLSPNLQSPIALGYVSLDHSKNQTEVQISLGKKTISAKVVKPPFVEL